MSSLGVPPVTNKGKLLLESLESMAICTSNQAIAKYSDTELSIVNIQAEQDLSGYSLTSHNHNAVYEPLKGENDNFVTDSQLAVLSNTSGTNTGDQTLPTRASLGLDTTDIPQFAGINIGHASDTTITRVSAGVIAVEGVQIATGTGTASGTNTGDQISIVGITGTIAQFNTALTDGNFATGGGTATGTNTGDQTLPTDATLTVSDITTNNVSTSAHGFAPKVTDTSLFLKGDGTWASPPGGTEAFPVGSVFIAVVDTDPGTLLGYGTWSAFGAGKMLVSLDSGDTDFDVAEETGGAKTKTIAQANLPNISTGAGTSHNHTQDAHSHVLGELRSATTGGSSTN